MKKIRVLYFGSSEPETKDYDIEDFIRLPIKGEYICRNENKMRLLYLVESVRHIPKDGRVVITARM